MWPVEKRRNKEGKKYFFKKKNIWPAEEKRNRGYFKQENIKPVKEKKNREEKGVEEKRKMRKIFRKGKMIAGGGESQVLLEVLVDLNS